MRMYMFMCEVGGWVCVFVCCNFFILALFVAFIVTFSGQKREAQRFVWLLFNMCV